MDRQIVGARQRFQIPHLNLSMCLPCQAGWTCAAPSNIYIYMHIAYLKTWMCWRHMEINKIIPKSHGLWENLPNHLLLKPRKVYHLFILLIQETATTAKSMMFHMSLKKWWYSTTTFSTISWVSKRLNWNQPHAILSTWSLPICRS